MSSAINESAPPWDQMAVVTVLGLPSDDCLGRIMTLSALFAAAPRAVARTAGRVLTAPAPAGRLAERNPDFAMDVAQINCEENQRMKQFYENLQSCSSGLLPLRSG